MQNSSSDDSHEFKPLLVEIEDRPLNPLGRTVFWVIIAALVFFTIWMFVGKVDVVVTARGKVIPDGEVKMLQPLTTGVVSGILVKPGDFVQKGQVLMEIDPSDIEPELESMKANLKQLDLEILRLECILEHKPFAPDVSKYDESIIKVQNEIYYSTIKRLQKQLRVKAEELKQVEEQLESMKTTRAQNVYLLNLSQDRLSRLKEVKDILSKDEYDKAESDYKDNEKSIKTVGHKINELVAARARIFKEIDFIKEDERNKLLTELVEKRKNYKYLRANMDKAAYISARQQIVTPVNGYVNKLFIHTIGGVVTPAEKLVSIVPANSPLVIKAMVRNKDIGFVSVGMNVSIKIDTFSFQKYGLLKGTVKHVSRDSIEDENLGLVYEVYVNPSETSLLVEGIETPITTGMSLTAEIKVGKRRIIEFFIYPLIKYLDEGISVR